MESKKINQLATNLAPVSTDLTVIGNPTTGELKKITLLQISSLFGGGISSIGMVVPSGFSVSPSTLTANGTFTISGAGTTAQYIRGDGSLATFPTFLSSDKLIQEVRNNSGATMLKGTIVYINGAVGNKATIAKALASSDATSAQTYGVVQDDISNNSNGYIVIVGEVTGLDTSAVTEGQQLYLSGSIAGYYTVTKPYAPIHLVYVAIVLRSHPTQGILGIKIQNGYEMDELHNVDAVSPSNNDGLFYNTTTSLWEHKPITTALGYTPVPYTGATGSVDLGTYDLLTTGSLSGVDLFGTTLFIREQTAGSISTIPGHSALNVSDTYFSFARSSSQKALFYYQAGSYSYTLPSASGTLALLSNINAGTVTSVAALTLGTTGTDLSSSVATGTTTPVITLNVPTASATNRGALSSADWTTFNSKFNLPSLTSGSVLFSNGTTIAQDNANFFWDDTNNRLGIGTASPSTRLDIQGTTATDGGQLGSELTTTGSGTNWVGSGFATGYTHTTGSTAALTTSLAATSSTFYQIICTITGRTTGTITISYGGISNSGLFASINIGQRATSTASLTITPTTDFNGTIVISIKAVSAGSSLINLRNSAGTIATEVRANGQNFYIGFESGKYNTLGQNNIAIGYQALVNNIVSSNNIAFGYQTLQNTIATDNIAFGYRAGTALTSGYSNILFGTNTGGGLTTGHSNVFFGNAIALSATTAAANIFFGTNVGQGLTTGAENFLAVAGAGQGLTSGSNNIAIGAQSLIAVGSQSNNIGIGQRAGAYTSSYSSIAPSNCIYIGVACFSGSTTPSNEIVIGSTTSTIGLGSNTTLIGTPSTVTAAIRGRLLLGTTTDSGSYQLDVNGTARVSGALTVTGSTTAASAIARGALVSSTLVAAANSDVLVGLDINPTFTNGAFTSVTQIGYRGQVSSGTGKWNLYMDGTANNYLNGTLGIGTTSPKTYSKLTVNGQLIGLSTIAIAAAQSYRFNNYYDSSSGTDKTISAGYSGDVFQDNTFGTILFRSNSSTVGADTTITNVSKFGIFTTGNVLIQNGGTFTDAGYRLDVNGTARVSGNATFGTLGSGTGMFWDNTNNRLGIGTASPSFQIHATGSIIGNALFSATNLTVGATTAATTSSIVDIISTTSGVLLPRMTTTQKNAIATPAAGLMVYDTTLNKLCVYTTAWEVITSI